MKKFYFATMLTLCSITAFAQEFAVTGRVVDADNKGEGLPLAQVAVFTKDTVKVTATVSDNDGYFRLQPKNGGEYLLSVTFIGYEPLWKKVKLSEKTPHKKMGQLQMNPDSKLLREVQVTGLAQELTIKADTFVYHSNAFRVPEGASLAALIKQLPGLQMDSEGNLTFQGKAVGSILVNGKPFFGDANTAMANMSSAAVEDVKVYEKTDEEKEFTGLHDNNKQTVIDLKIKKEYMSSWSVNLTAAGGTSERFTGKLFASNFSDKYRAAVYAQANNLSQWQSADENGNWRYYSLPGAMRTYRTVGGILSWNNGKKNTETGYFDSNAEVTYAHNNTMSLTTAKQEQLMGANAAHYSYSRGNGYTSATSPSINAGFTWNIDTLNRLRMQMYYDSYNNGSDNTAYTSTYSSEASWSDAYKTLTQDDIDKDIESAGINSLRGIGRNIYCYDTYHIYTNYVRRLTGVDGALTIRGIYRGSRNRTKSYDKLHYRYFNSQEPDVTRNDYTYSPGSNDRYELAGDFTAPIGKHLNYGVSYTYTHKQDNNNHILYRLDRLASPDYPLGWHPSTADSLLLAKDLENSKNETYFANTHNVEGSLSGRWDKFEFSTTLSAEFLNEKIFFVRDTERHSPQRSVMLWRPFAQLKWKPVKGGEISINYSGDVDISELSEKIPFTDTSNETETVINNNNLRNGWRNNFGLRGNYFGDKRGDSYSMYANFGFIDNDCASTMLVDPATGKTTLSMVNVDGNYNYNVGFNTQQPLDSARHWTLTVNTSLRSARSKSYTGNSSKGMGLSVMHSYNPHAGMWLKWRKDIWSIVLSGAYTGDIVRYDNSSGYNQTGSTFEWNLQPMVELPFGMKISGSFGLYGRRGYGGDIMNHDQWLWNMTISQSLLKNKALTIQLDAVDILGQRTSENTHISNISRMYSSSKSYLSYVMLSAVYRFDIGRK